MPGIRNFVLRIVLIGLVLALWEAAVTYFAVPKFILPPPSQVFYGLYNGFGSGLYIDHLQVTLVETFMGFALGCCLAFVFGAMVALSRSLEYFFYPSSSCSRPCPRSHWRRSSSFGSGWASPPKSSMRRSSPSSR